MAHARLHDHSNALDGSPIAVAGVPNLDVAKITSGVFDVARLPPILYVGDETVKNVTGTVETEIKTFRMIRNLSHGRDYSTVYFIGEAYVSGGTGSLKVSVDGAASVTVWTFTDVAYALQEGSIDVAWADDSIHTISVRLVNDTAGKVTYNRTLEAHVK